MNKYDKKRYKQITLNDYFCTVCGQVLKTSEELSQGLCERCLLIKTIETLVKPIAEKNPIYNCWTLLNTCDSCEASSACELQSPYNGAKQILNIIKKYKKGVK